jgi:hypothetical protein
MMTLKRLLDESEADFASALLRSAALDVPGSAQVRRGVLAVTTAGSALASAGAVSAASSAVAGAGAAPIGLGALGLAKWVGVGLAAGFVTAGTGAYVASDSAGFREAPEQTPASVSAVETPLGRSADLPEHEEQRGSFDTRAASAFAAPIQSDAAAEPVGSEPAARVSGGLEQRARRRDEPVGAVATGAWGQPTSPVSAEAQPASTPARGSVTSFPHPAASTASAGRAQVIAPSSERARSAAMSAELAALARARTALAARTPAVVFAELETYRRLSRTHVLDAEAFVLRIEALVQLGRAAEAATLAKSYLATNPRSPHRVRLAQVARLGDR